MDDFSPELDCLSEMCEYAFLFSYSSLVCFIIFFFRPRFEMFYDTICYCILCKPRRIWLPPTHVTQGTSILFKWLSIFDY